MTFSYEFFVNVTFDPTRAYINFDGYRPGALLEKAYTGEIDAADAKAACEKLFEKFNMDHPADYKNRSMSVGDVLMLTDGLRVLYFACESVGWKAIGDPALQPPMKGVCTVETYRKHAGLYAEMQKNQTTAHFLDAVRYAEAKAAPPVTLTLNAVETEMLYALVVAAVGNGTPVDAEVRINLRKKLARLSLEN
jgi:hypothetical protein